MTEQIDTEKLQHFVPFDGLSSNHLRLLASQMTLMQLPPTRLLFKRGEASDNAYFLISGSVDLADASFQVHHFNADDDENYLALDDFPKHSVSAITTENTLVYAFPRHQLALINEWNQLGTQQDDKEDDQQEESWMDALLESGLFAQIPPTKIQSLFARFESCKVTMGETVIQQGDNGDTLFVIKQGYALVRRQQGNQETTLAAIYPGQFFGEEALISDRPRGASIVMASDGELMKLGKEDFRSLLQDSVVRHLTQEQLDQLMEDGDRSCILLDIRVEMESKHNRIPGARNIPLSELRGELQSLEKSFTYVVCGEGGTNAELGAYLLSDAGLDAYVLASRQEDKADQNDTRNSSVQPTETGDAADESETPN
jgi:CRP-like cAMP-binding protein